MNVASLKLCKRLYELSEWGGTEHDHGVMAVTKEVPDGDGGSERLIAYIELPAYDLGYLMRKLPRKLNGINSMQRDGQFNLATQRKSNILWTASYIGEESSVIRRKKIDAVSNNYKNFWWVHISGDTPEDAAAKLAIKLFEQGILTKQEADA